MNFRKFLEMASFSLSEPIKINNKLVNAIDMHFEFYPKTKNQQGKVMNQGSKFIAKLPNSNDYLAYDGQGRSFIINSEEKQKYLSDGYEIIDKNWYKKANLI